MRGWSHLRPILPRAAALCMGLAASLACWALASAPAAAQSRAAGAAPAPAAAIDLLVTTYLGDAQDFVEGDPLGFLVSTDRTAFVLLIYQDAAGRVLQLLPNRYSRDARFAAGRFVSVPADSDPFEFTVAAPFGRETLWAFAADRPFPPLPGRELDNGLRLLADEPGAIRRRLLDALGADGGFGEARLSLHTRPGRR